MKKTKNYAMPYPEQDDYFNVEDFQDMMVSVDNLMKKLSDSGAQISSDAEHLYNQTKAQMDNIQKRMNAFTALRDGSTTGDAELKDIRVAYDGKEYGNAGEAVREQASVYIKLSLVPVLPSGQRRNQNPRNMLRKPKEFVF